MNQNYQTIIDNIDINQFDVVVLDTAYLRATAPAMTINSTLMEFIENLEPFGNIEFNDREILLLQSESNDCFVIVQLIYSVVANELAEDDDDDDSEVDIIVSHNLLAFSLNFAGIATCLNTIINLIDGATLVPSNFILREIAEAQDDDDDDTDDDNDDDDADADDK